jgi:hypothetical protein
MVPFRSDAGPEIQNLAIQFKIFCSVTRIPRCLNGRTSASKFCLSGVLPSPDLDRSLASHLGLSTVHLFQRFVPLTWMTRGRRCGFWMMQRDMWVMMWLDTW